MPTEENPIVEIRSRLGRITKWSNAHTKIAKALYILILETLNLGVAVPSEEWKKISCIDVEVDIDGRHATCDRARMPTSSATLI